jgi:glycosyltransferase involved in cell wall biosynthesis
MYGLKPWLDYIQTLEALNSLKIESFTIYGDCMYEEIIISAIMPVFNRSEDVLNQSINSFVLQNILNSELVIINDGSEKHIADFLDTVASKHKKIKVFHQNNKGASASRNFGITKSKGKYIAFLDDDDIWRPNKLELQLKYLENNAEIAGCFTNAELFTENKIIGSLIEIKGGIDKYKLDSDSEWHILPVHPDIELIIKGYILTSTLMIKKNVLVDAGYYSEELPVGEDIDLMYRVTRKNKLVYYNDVTTRYRVTENSLSRSGLKTLLQTEKLYEKMKSYQLTTNEKQYMNDADHLLCFSIGYHYFENEKFIDARSWFAKSFKYGKSISDLLYITATLLPEVCIRLLRKIKQNL